MMIDPVKNILGEKICNKHGTKNEYSKFLKMYYCKKCENEAEFNYEQKYS